MEARSSSRASPETLGLRALPEFAGMRALNPAAPRADALRAAARAFRRRFADGGVVTAVRTIDVAETPYPARLVASGVPAFVGAWVTLLARMVIVQFDDFGGSRRTLVWEPARADSLARLRPHGRSVPGQRMEIARPGRPRTLSSVQRGLAAAGLAPDQVDFVSCGDLRGHDLRSLLGTSRPTANEHAPRAPLLAGAWFLTRRAELEIARAPHPVLAPWYVEGGAIDVIEDRLVALRDDVELGRGVALVSTPGLTSGHQSLLLNLSDGIWVMSGNGVASDCWQPLLSKLPGVRRAAERDGRETVIAADAAERALDLYDSMVLERSLADASRVDPRWLSILPTRELAAKRRQWPVLPTFSHGAVTHGRIHAPARAAVSPGS
jgi:hypothetical protein